MGLGDDSVIIPKKAARCMNCGKDFFPEEKGLEAKRFCKASCAREYFKKE